MAGIGFSLRKLARQDNLIGVIRAYLHSAFISTGPWLLTVVAIGTIVLLSSQVSAREELHNFQLIIIYNFAFSLVISAPLCMVVTRYLADRIYHKDVSCIPGTLMGSLTLLLVSTLPLAAAFYFGYAKMPFSLAVNAIINFLCISMTWLVCVFLSTLKNFSAITRAFTAGLLIGVVVSVLLAPDYGATGMLVGFNVGIASILFALIARVFSEYSAPVVKPFGFFPYFRKYWELAVGGLIFNMGAWVDKWIMWFSPEAERLPCGLISFPNYDSAMFLAYLTVVPAMAAFVFSVETSFFERYLRFYRDIQQQASLEKIKTNHRHILSSLNSSGRNFLVLQGVIAVVVILSAASLFDLFSINFLQLGIFRFGVLGALFHVFTLFLLIILSYFDARKKALMLQGLFLLTNTAFTLFFMQKGLGFPYYGYGYFLASLTTFVAAAFVVERYVARLPYHTFITNNALGG